MSSKKITGILLISVFLFGLLIYFTTSNGNKSVQTDDTSVSSVADFPVKSNIDNQRISELENQVNEISLQQTTIIEHLQKLLTTKNDHIDDTIPEQLNPIQPDINTPQALSQEVIDEMIEKENDYFVQIEQNFDNESKDHAWSINEENKLRSILQIQGLSQASIDSIECRSKTCRADIGHDDKISAEQFMETFMRSLPDNTAGELDYKDNENGGVNTLMFLTPASNG